MEKIHLKIKVYLIIYVTEQEYGSISVSNNSFWVEGKNI